MNMKDRCSNRKNKAYPRYGGRGITVCDRWQHSYESFLEDMGRRPDGLTLDRIDNSKGYSPENCRWATPAEQAKNRRSNVMVEYSGKRMNLKDASVSAGLPYKTVYARIAGGWSFDAAISTPVRIRR